jgi:uncharacterized protein (DUF427 family)
VSSTTDSAQPVRVSPRHPVPVGDLTYQAGERRVRGMVGDLTVVDSRNPVYVWEPGWPVPLYAFPRADVRTDLLVPTEATPKRSHPGATQYFDLVIDGQSRPVSAWAYAGEPLAGLIAFDWFLRSEPNVDHWYEEEQEIFVHPRDPYKRVDPLPSTRHVEISINGSKVADSTRAILLFETRMPIRYYIPAADVDFSHLAPSDLTTRCPYKGIANYWSFTGDPRADDVVWSYPDPIPAAGNIKDYFAFYNEHVDISVDGEPQPRPEPMHL